MFLLFLANIHACIHTCMHTYTYNVSTYTHTCIQCFYVFYSQHTYIHAYNVSKFSSQHTYMHTYNVSTLACVRKIDPSCSQGGHIDLFAHAERSRKRSVGSTAGSTRGTMDSATLEQQPLHHYKRPYLRLANSVAESRDRCNGATIRSRITGEFIASSKLRMRVGVERS
jgi:hypothetical protein